MKTLYLNRHAKSSWDYPSLSDFDRPLNKRGNRDAPIMAQILSSKYDMPDLICSSPAVRALTTAKIIAEGFEYDQEKIVEDQEIYDGGVSDLISIISNVTDEINVLMLFGHNPTFTMASNYLSDKLIENIPTSGFVKINFEFDSWNKIEVNTGKLIAFEYPKKYLK